MSKFFCNGADSECACPILCADCTAADWTGGTEIKTNADRIRAMSDDELAEFLWDFNLADVSTVKMGEFGPHMFRHRLKEWLQQPAEEDDHDERKENENVRR